MIVTPRSRRAAAAACSGPAEGWLRPPFATSCAPHCRSGQSPASTSSQQGTAHDATESESAPARRLWSASRLGLAQPRAASAAPVTERPQLVCDKRARMDTHELSLRPLFHGRFGRLVGLPLRFCSLRLGLALRDEFVPCTSTPPRLSQSIRAGGRNVVGAPQLVQCTWRTGFGARHTAHTLFPCWNCARVTQCT